VIHVLDVEFIAWRRAGVLLGWRLNVEEGPPGPMQERVRIRLREDPESGWEVVRSPLGPIP